MKEEEIKEGEIEVFEVAGVAGGEDGLVGGGGSGDEKVCLGAGLALFGEFADDVGIAEERRGHGSVEFGLWTIDAGRRIAEVGFDMIDPIEFGEQGDHGRALCRGLESLVIVELIHANNGGHGLAAAAEKLRAFTAGLHDFRKARLGFGDFPS